MPHKDRTERLAYLAKYRAAHRPAPKVELQPDAILPPRGKIVFSADGSKVQCHVCGRWLGNLNSHFRTHGLDAAVYKEIYGLARTVSLLSPANAQRQREAALARDQGAIGRDNLPTDSSRPAGLDTRLSSRIEASRSRAGIYTRGGEKPRSY